MALHALSVKWAKCHNVQVLGPQKLHRKQDCIRMKGWFGEKLWLSHLENMLKWIGPSSETSLYLCLPLGTVLLKDQAKRMILEPNNPESQKEFLRHCSRLNHGHSWLYVQLEKHHTGLGKVQEKSRGMTNNWDY